MLATLLPCRNGDDTLSSWWWRSVAKRVILNLTTWRTCGGSSLLANNYAVFDEVTIEINSEVKLVERSHFKYLWCNICKLLD
jgi:hypothetical protein